MIFKIHPYLIQPDQLFYTPPNQYHLFAVSTFIFLFFVSIVLLGANDLIDLEEFGVDLDQDVLFSLLVLVPSSVLLMFLLLRFKNEI